MLRYLPNGTEDREARQLRLQHLQEVRQVYSSGITDPHEISQALILPLWNVKRALASMGVISFDANKEADKPKVLRNNIGGPRVSIRTKTRVSK